jgi:hypothetical protein
MFKPIYIQEFNIYDVFHSDNNDLIIVCPIIIKDESILEIFLHKDSYNLKFQSFKCPHYHTIIHTCTDISFTENIKLIINNKEIVTKVNKYPIFTNEIIMCTSVKNEDNYMVQWIKYHMLLGITRFIIYDNTDSSHTRYCSVEKKSNLSLLLADYINNKIVTLIKWIYPKMTDITGLTGQTTQQNHSIYAFNTSKYIGLFDIDEYINPQIPEIKLENIFNNTITNNNLNIDKIGGFTILQKSFYNPNKSSTNNYEFLKIYNCGEVDLKGRMKVFVIPKNIKIFSVHKILIGFKSFIINKDEIYFNHYMFLNKMNRALNKTEFFDNSIERIVKLLN